MSDVRMVKLGDLCEINPRAPKLTDETLISFVSMSDLSSSKARTISETSRPYHEVKKGYTGFQDQDILIAKITPCWENIKIGIANIKNNFGFGSTEFHVIRASDEVTRRYLLHFLRNPHVNLQGQLRMTGSGGQKRVPAKFFEDLQVPLPSLEEQKRIVAILDKAQSIQEARKRQLATLDELLISIFKDSFHAEDYPHKPLKEIATVLSGGTPRSSVQEYWNGNLEWVTPADLGQHEGIYFSSSSRKITDAGLKNSSAVLLPTGSVMMSSRAPIGHLAINTVPMATNQGFKSIVPGEEITNLYLLFWLKSHMSYIQSLGVGATFKEISKKVVENIKVPLPPITEQNRFSQKISKTISQKNLIHKSLEKDKSLFLSIQSSFFNY